MIFDGLTPREIEQVEKLGAVRVYRQDACIIEEGAGGTTFHLVLSGHVEVRKRIAGGRFKKLVELGPCGMFGEVAFLGVKRRTASVVALQDCEVLEFDSRQVDQFMAKHPAIGLKVYRGMARELAQRLAQSDDDIKDAIIWAMGEAKDQCLTTRAAINIPLRPKLTLNPHRAMPLDRELSQDGHLM